MTKKTGGAAPAASGGGVAATSTASTASNPSLENQTPATSVDSKTSAADTANQPKAPPEQSGDGAGNAESKATDSAAGASLENQTPAPPVDSTAPTAPVLDLWVLNIGVKAITESRTRTLLAVDRTTQIKISSPQVRATVIRNLEQLNHLAGAEYLKAVDQPPILDKVE
ncbi:MAG: hypothetical protein WA154_00720 [Moraxellaceae bacterium]